MNRVVLGVAGLAAIVLGVGTAHAAAGLIGPSAAAIAGDAWYDDHYGPVYRGYWTPAGDYYFSIGPARPFVRDDGRHFRQVMLPGFRPVEGLAALGANGRSAAR